MMNDLSGLKWSTQDAFSYDSMLMSLFFFDISGTTATTFAPDVASYLPPALAVC